VSARTATRSTRSTGGAESQLSAPRIPDSVFAQQLSSASSRGMLGELPGAGLSAQLNQTAKKFCARPPRRVCSAAARLSAAVPGAVLAFGSHSMFEQQYPVCGLAQLQAEVQGLKWHTHSPARMAALTARSCAPQTSAGLWCPSW
jgi:hypothetical protein